MRHSFRAVVRGLTFLVMVSGCGVARADGFQTEGIVFFSNVQAGIQQGGTAPYLAFGWSKQIGPHIQTGTIRNLSGLIPVDPTTLIFYGEVGPHPTLPGHPKIHLITTSQGTILCTWTAVFTLEIINAKGVAVFSGDGDFTIVGGTGRYRHASGRFRTLFETLPVAPGADQAVAEYSQTGELSDH